MKLSTGQKLSAGVGLALFSVSITSWVSYRTITAFIQDSGKVEQSWHGLRELANTRDQVMIAETKQRNYLLTGDESELGAYRLAITATKQAIAELRLLTGDNPDQQQRLDILEPLVAKATTELDKEIAVRRNSGVAVPLQGMLEGQDMQFEKAISRVLTEMEGEENRALNSRLERRDSTAQRLIFATVARNSLAFLYVAIASLIIYRDILVRNRAEAELQQLKRQHELILQSVADGIQVLDLQGKVTFVNPAAARMLGYISEELSGQPVHDILHHATPDTACHLRDECPIYATLNDGDLHHEMDGVFWRKDGSSFPVEYFSAPIREQGVITGSVVTFRDISERQATERMKDEFVSVVSHELRTPLTSIRGALGLLTSGLVGALPEKGQRMLEIAVNNTDRLVRLINDILDLERMQSGKVTMRRQLCDAEALLTQATEEMQGIAEKAGVALIMTPHQSLPLWVDPDRIVQTLTNLLGNAIKFSPTGATVWVNVARQDREAVVTVRDQGRGIPADKMASIFERFQQVDASDARKQGGTGLGLTICRSIVEQHGGRIWVESQPGEGSAFSFTLPLWLETEPAATAPDGRLLVLACDDDPSMLEMVHAALEQRGYQVVTVTTGQEAVAQAEARQPAVILLDLLMPQMSGWDTMAELKRRPTTRHIPIIIFSILSPQEAPPLQADFVEWVQKSSGEAALLQALKRALEERTKVPRVLIVEDDLDLTKIQIAMFQRHGIETAYARTGQEAIQQCGKLRPDLLVLDLLLPDGNGFVVADWLRQQDQLRHMPVVIYSAKDVDDSERQRLQLGHTEFLTKARITPGEFEQHVMALLIHLVPPPGENPLHNI